MKKENIKDLRSRIIQGLDLAYTRLLVSKQKDDAELVFSKDGKIIRVKARDLTQKLQADNNLASEPTADPY